MTRRIMLFELNEVPWRIVDEFVAEHPNSAFARLLPRSRCYTSIAADRGHLSPWTTWPTLHRGVTDEQHMTSAFGPDRSEADECFPPVWQLLRAAGVSVGVCGSLHTFPTPPDIDGYSFYLPDSFATESTAHPPQMVPFQEFQLMMVRASARNVDTAVPRDAALRFLRSSHKIGVRAATYVALVGQLAAERRRPWLSTRRPSIQAMVAFDVFVKALTDTRPAFSSFFTNHVASAIGLGDGWMDRYREEVRWAMSRADRMIGRLAGFADENPDYELWIAGMPQGMLAIYDPHDPLSEPGVRRDVSVLEVAPAILHTFGVTVPGYMQEPGVLAREPVPHSVGTF